MSDYSIHTGNISGNTGLAVGAGARAEVHIGSEQKGELAELIAQLRAEIAASAVNQGAKEVLARGAVADLEKAAAAAKPDGVGAAIGRVDETLQAAGATVEHVSSIAATLGKIAHAAGLVFQTVAPFLSAFVV